jgi:hypothetical protein
LNWQLLLQVLINFQKCQNFLIFWVGILWIFFEKFDEILQYYREFSSIKDFYFQYYWFSQFSFFDIFIFCSINLRKKF